MGRHRWDSGTLRRAAVARVVRRWSGWRFCARVILDTLLKVTKCEFPVFVVNYNWHATSRIIYCSIETEKKSGGAFFVKGKNLCLIWNLTQRARAYQFPWSTKQALGDDFDKWLIENWDTSGKKSGCVCRRVTTLIVGSSFRNKFESKNGSASSLFYILYIVSQCNGN